MAVFRRVTLTFLSTLLVGLALQWTANLAQANPGFSPPSIEKIQVAALNWAKGRGLNQPQDVEAISLMWRTDSAEPTTDEKFDGLMRTFYLIDADVRTMVDGCVTLQSPLSTGEFAALQSHENEPLFINNVRYFYARYLSALTLYEESLEQFSKIDPEHLVDPAGYFFHKSVSQHALLRKTDGLASLETLLSDVAGVPTRYRQLGEMMKQDLTALEEESLGEVASQMKDAQRRLALGRAGEKCQRVEDQIIATLDAIIAKLEQCDCDGNGKCGGKPGSKKAAKDGYTNGVKGPGQTDAKEIGHQDNWGALPEKAQSAAKNMINRQFPAHYRQAVEEYLKKLANRPAT